MYYAQFWQRAAAALIDIAVLAAVTAVIAVLIGVNPLGPLTGDTKPGFQVLDAVFFILGWFYFAFMECNRLQGTFGKLALGIRVTDLEGQRLHFDRATGRYFGKVLSTLPLLAGFIMAAFSQRHQALHDRMAGALVVTR